MKQQIDQDILLQQARDGNSRSFNQLVKLHQSRVYSVALRLLGSQSEAEDVLQETFIALYQNLHHFRGGSKLATYLFRLATNFSLMKLRRSKRRGSDSSPLSLNVIEELPDKAASPLESLLSSEFRAVLDQQLQKLPAKDRAVVVLRDIEGLDGWQVAKILGLTLPAMKSKLHRSREFLRKNLSGYLKDS
jgi:RNA polymerase sigma-70 factor (ECF subfamily)